MQTLKSNDESNYEAERRIQRLSLHLNPIPIPHLTWNHHHHPLQMENCSRGGKKLIVDANSLTDYMRGKYRDIQEKVFDYFNANPQLQTPLEISKDNHRELCMNQLLGLVRGAGIRPLHYVVNDPAKYFAILEAVGSVDMSLGIKMGVQYSLWGGSVINLGTQKHKDKYYDGIDNLDFPGCFAMTELHHG
ncbi:peroxisomal acyl-CoA oxidase, partial [Trifolium pratense]